MIYGSPCSDQLGGHMNGFTLLPVSTLASLMADFDAISKERLTGGLCQNSLEKCPDKASLKLSHFDSSRLVGSLILTHRLQLSWNDLHLVGRSGSRHFLSHLPAWTRGQKKAPQPETREAGIKCQRAALWATVDRNCTFDSLMLTLILGTPDTTYSLFWFLLPLGPEVCTVYGPGY